MNKQLFLNNFTTVFAASVKNAPVTGTPATELDYGILRLSDGAAGALTNPAGGDYYILTAFKKSGSTESAVEIMKVTAVDNATVGECRITVLRAQEGTTLQGYVAGDYISLRLTRDGAINFAQTADLAAAVADKADLDSPTFTGTVGGITAAMVGAQVVGTYATGTGSAEGVNTGDDTAFSIKTKLGISVLSGSNSGDQTGGTPAISLGLANTAGTSLNFLRTDDTILAFDATVPAALGVAATGSATVAARRDHVHTAPTTITGNAGTVTNATLTTALTINTGTVTVTGNVANTSVLTLGAGASSVSGANTGDNATNTQYSGLVTNATHTGDATGATALTVVKINGTLMSGLATGILKNTTGTGVPSIATAGTDYVTPAGAETLSGKTLTGYTETVYALAGTVIDPANGTVQTKTLSGNTTFTESIGDGQSVVLMLNPSTFTTTWPTTSWVRADGSAAAPTLKASVFNTIVLWQVGGVLYGNWIGSM